MTAHEIQNTIKNALIKDLRLEDLDPSTMDADALLFGEDGIGLDSLDAVELVVVVEKYFGVVIADADTARDVFISLNTLTNFIREQHKNVATAP